MATANARSRGKLAVHLLYQRVRVPASPSADQRGEVKSSGLRQRIHALVAERAGDDRHRHRERTQRMRQQVDQWPRAFRARVRGEHQHGDVGILVDHRQQLFHGGAFPDHPFRGDRGDAVGAAGGTVERGFCRLLRLGAHDVGDPQPFLALLFGLDDAEHHHTAAGADRPAAGVIDRAIPLGGVVDDDEAFGLVTRLEAKSLAGHACPGMCTADMLPHSISLGESRSGRRRGVGRGFASAPQRRRMKPTMSFESFMVSSAIARARSAPSFRTASIWPGSATRRFISPAIGASLVTHKSTSAFLKLENWPPPKSLSTSALERPESAAKMPTRLSASGRASRPFSSVGSGSGSVLALRTFCAMVSASSVKLMRELSDASDFDIFLVPSRKLMTRVAGPVIKGSGSGKNRPSLAPWLRIESAKSLLNFCAMSRDSSRCCFWSSPTGTWVAR